MKSFITWRLNFYRFKWWRQLAGIPEPRPVSNAQLRVMLDTIAPMLDFSVSVNRDYENFWRASPTADVIPIRRPTPFKANQKDRYL